MRLGKLQSDWKVTPRTRNYKFGVLFLPAFLPKNYLFAFRGVTIHLIKTSPVQKGAISSVDVARPVSA